MIEEAWGYHTLIDAKHCNPEIIRSKEKIIQYAIELCKLIDMKRFGECEVDYFGDDPKVAGFTMVQKIETSLVSAHFRDRTNKACIDIFSCKPYGVEEAVHFTEKYFEADRADFHFILRD